MSIFQCSQRFLFHTSVKLPGQAYAGPCFHMFIIDIPTRNIYNKLNWYADTQREI